MDILIVEDNPSHLKLAHTILSSAGFSVNGVGASDEALDQIQAKKPQLILLDLELPGTDGLALVMKLKGNPETADIQVIAVTSYPERFPKARMLAAGCVAYIDKPIDTRRLPSQVEQLLR